MHWQPLLWALWHRPGLACKPRHCCSACPDESSDKLHLGLMQRLPSLVNNKQIPCLHCRENAARERYYVKINTWLVSLEPAGRPQVRPSLHQPCSLQQLQLHVVAPQLRSGFPALSAIKLRLSQASKPFPWPPGPFRGRPPCTWTCLHLRLQAWRRVVLPQTLTRCRPPQGGRSPYLAIPALRVQDRTCSSRHGAAQALGTSNPTDRAQDCRPFFCSTIFWLGEEETVNLNPCSGRRIHRKPPCAQAGRCSS